MVADTVLFSLEPPAEAAQLTALRQAVEAAVTGNARRVVVDLGTLDVLDSPVIATLIAVLRGARERGAEVYLVSERKRVLDTLRVTGLDKVFTLGHPAGPAVVAPVATAPKRAKRPKTPAGRKGLGGIRAAVVTGLLLAALAGPGASRVESAGQGLPPDEILTRLAAQNPQMQSYQARVHVDFQLRSFPYITQHLEGTTYFKRPDSYEIVFKDVPPYARGFDKLYSDIGDPSSWPKRYAISVIGEKAVGKHHDLILRLVQRVRGMIDHEDVAVDPSAWHIDNMEWDYYNGGIISMSQEYESIAGFSVLRAQHATIHIPFVHASAEGRYDDYHPNVPIDDAVFTRVKHP
jgi:anti-anti-sigma factor